MPTLVACTGFEYGTTAGLATGDSGNTVFDTVTNVSIVTTSPRTGTYCLEATGAATGARNCKWRSAQFGSTAVLVGGVGLYVASLPSTDNDAICVETNGTIDVFLFVSSSGVLTGQVGATSQAGPTLSTGQWYWIDFKVDCSTGTTTLDWQVDGTAQTQVSAAQTATTIFSYTLGRLSGTATFTYRYDDPVASVTSADYPFGPHAVQMLIPDTGGTTTQIGTANATARFTNNSTAEITHNSASILAAISEVPPLIGASATGVCQRTSGTGNAVGIPMTTYSLQAGESVSGVRVLVCGWSGSATTNTIGLRAYNGTAETTLFATANPNFDNSTTTPGWLCKMYSDVTDQTTLDALVIRYGYSSDISPLPGAHAIYAEVAVKEATQSATQISVADSGGGTEAVSVAAATPVADSGTSTQALTTSATFTVTDSGTSTQSLAVSVPTALADTGSGTETLVAGVAIGLADTGTGTETSTVTAALNLAETGTGTETPQVTAAVSLTQTGTGTETVTVSAATGLTDTGLGADSLIAGITIPLADTGTATENLAVLPVVALADAGTGTLTVSVAALAALAETGAATELLTIVAAAPLADIGTGLDVLATLRPVALADSGAGSDTLDSFEGLPYEPAFVGVDSASTVGTFDGRTTSGAVDSDTTVGVFDHTSRQPAELAGITSSSNVD